jgi:predicted ribosome quality control (RQC) complex YloA/Tae2 family protein
MLNLKFYVVNETTLQAICDELETYLVGKKFGKIFPLSRFQLAIDFRLSDLQYLLFSVEPSAPRAFLIKRRLRDLEKQAKNSSPFVSLLRSRLSNAILQKISKVANERILRLIFSSSNELGQAENCSMVIQLTGRSANVFLLDKNNFVLDTLRETAGAGQEVGDLYAPPEKRNEETHQRERDAGIFPQAKFNTLSEAIDTHYLEIEVEKTFQAKANAARNKIKQETSKRTKLVKKLKQDLENHGDAEAWKRFGDLLLANLATAVREGEKVLVIDYYQDSTPTVEVEIDENQTLTEAAEKFFKRYTKARNAQTEISKRLEIVNKELTDLTQKRLWLEQAIEEKDENLIADFSGAKIEKIPVKPKEKQTENFKGAKQYVSSDGFDILVGKGAKDNDFLTFRVARSADLWLHAADYPGSHVIVKNPNRNEIPQKTLLEAAEIAAFFSQARSQGKVAVHYTQKKFVNKPKGAGAGLVSLASFKTILVEPKVLEKQTS